MRLPCRRDGELTGNRDGEQLTLRVAGRIGNRSREGGSSGCCRCAGYHAHGRESQLDGGETIGSGTVGRPGLGARTAGCHQRI